jgi:hypothetical protein
MGKFLPRFQIKRVAQFGSVPKTAPDVPVRLLMASSVSACSFGASKCFAGDIGVIM